MRAPQISCSFSGHRPEKLPWGDNERDERCLALKDAIRQMVEKAYACLLYTSPSPRDTR